MPKDKGRCEDYFFELQGHPRQREFLRLAWQINKASQRYDDRFESVEDIDLLVEQIINELFDRTKTGAHTRRKSLAPDKARCQPVIPTTPEVEGTGEDE